MFGLFAKKGPFVARLAGRSEIVEVQAGDNLLKAALEAGVPWPHNCRVGSCGECRTRLINGKIKPLNDFSYVLSQEDLDSGMILACQSCLRSDVEVEIEIPAAPAVPSASVSGFIEGRNRLTHDIVEVTVRLLEPLPAYRAGQYADLAVPGVVDQPRSYSFAHAPCCEDPQRATFFIRKVPGGHLTTWLHEGNAEGAAVTIKGPFGSFWLRESDAPVLCVAGGSGLAPIRALLEQIADEGFSRPVNFIFGARTQRDLYCLDEMKSYEALGNSNFGFLPVLSAEPDDSTWSGARGFCTEYMTERVPNISECEVYLCGPPPMVDSALAVLSSVGIDKNHIFYDKFLDASHMPRGRT